MQKLVENGTIVLIADSNMVLTNGSSFVTVVRLAKEEDELNWPEITKAAAEELQKAESEEIW